MNWPVLVGGAAITAFFIAVSGCDRAAPVDGPESKYQIAEESDNNKQNRSQSPSTKIGDGQNETSRSNPWRSDETGINAANRMLGYAQMLRSRRQQVGPEQAIEDRRTMLEIADDLNQLELTPEQKLATFQLKSQALLALLSAGDETARPQLLETIETYEDDSDLNLARSASFLELSLVMSEYLGDESADVANLKKRFHAIAEKYAEDPEVAQRLTMLLSQLVARGRRTEAVEIMRDLSELYSKSENENMARLPSRLNDRIYLTESGFDLTINEVLAGGETDKFLQVLEELAIRQGGGRELYQETISGIRLLEQLGLYDEVKTINQKLIDNYRNHDDPVVVKLAERDTQKGNNRLALVSNPIKLTGKLLDGSQFDPDVLDDKVIAIFFWSAKFPLSVRAMQPLLSFYDRFRDDGFEIVSICIDENTDQAMKIFADQQPPWISLFRNDDSFDEMLDQLGIQMVPYLLLVDKTGKVDRIHVPLRDLEPALLELVGSIEQNPNPK